MRCFQVHCFQVHCFQVHCAQMRCFQVHCFQVRHPGGRWSATRVTVGARAEIGNRVTLGSGLAPLFAVGKGHQYMQG